MRTNHGNRGQRWEDRLDAWHASYRRSGRAYVVRTPPPVKLLSAVERGRFTACFSSAGPPDYSAIVDGRALVFDAKRTAKARLSFSAVADHQAQHLDEAELAGGLPWLAVSSGETGAWCVWWSEIRADWRRWRLRGGRPASLLLEASSACTPMDPTGWLEPVRAYLIESGTTAGSSQADRSSGGKASAT